jgi:hypothetical protein
LGTGIQANGSEATLRPDATTTGIANSTGTGVVTLDVLSSLRAWHASPASNFGWAILPTGTDDVIIDSSNGFSFYRPRLIISYIIAPVSPMAVDDVVRAAVDAAVMIDVLANDYDDNGDSLLIADISSPVNGAVSITAGGRAVLFTPRNGFQGTATFNYTVVDGQGGSYVGHVKVNVGASSPPVGIDDSTSTPYESSVLVDVLANDRRAPFSKGNVLTIDGTSVREYTREGILVQSIPVPLPVIARSRDVVDAVVDKLGRLHVFNASDAGCFASSYDPILEQWTHIYLGYSGTPGSSDAGDVGIFGDYLFFGSERVDLRDGSIRSFDTSIFGQSTSSIGRDGLLYAVMSGSPQHEVAVLDPLTLSELRTVELRSSIKPPDFRLNVTAITANEAGELFVIGDGHVFHLDANGQELARLQSAAGFDIDLADDGKIVAGNRDGMLVFTDTTLAGNTYFALSGLNSPHVTFIHAEASGGTLSIVAGSPTAPIPSGTTIIEGGQIRYTPVPGFSGAATFSYTVSDGQGGIDTATVTVNVAANLPPTVLNDAVSTGFNSPVTINVLSNDADPDVGQTLSVTVVDSFVGGTAAIDSGGTVTFTPSPDFFGAGSFSYMASDGHGGSSRATATIIVQR